jgi:hypothetical protein
MLFRNLLLVSLVALVGFSTVSAEDEKPAAMMGMEGMSHSMQKSMDPQVWMQMMTMMMDPAKAASMESCALCHEGEDLARYTKDFGPMMEPMQGMAKAFSPHQMVSQMNPFMNSMGGMMNPMSMMGPMMNPMSMMSMMYPAMGMMGPMMGMMGPMMNPMGMMGGMGGMNPMSMMGPMMNPMGMMGGMGGMNPMMGMMGGGANNANPMSSMMKPEQYTDWFNQMMKSFTPAESSASK